QRDDHRQHAPCVALLGAGRCACARSRPGRDVSRRRWSCFVGSSTLDPLPPGAVRRRFPQRSASPKRLQPLLPALVRDLHANPRPEFPERYLVARRQLLLARDPHAVHVRAVRAPDVHEHVAVPHGPDLRVPRRDIQVPLRIESEIAERVPADGNHGLRKPLAVAGPRAGQKAKVDAHGAGFISPDAVSCGAAPPLPPCALPNKPRAANTAAPNTMSATIVNSHALDDDRSPGAVPSTRKLDAGVGAVTMGLACSYRGRPVGPVISWPGSKNTACPTLSSGSASARPPPSKRAAITVMLSGPPFSLARSMRSRHTSTRSGWLTTTSAISSFFTSPDKPSVHSTSVSPRRSF